jgi:serine-type D-Ala-D-Ala carboxypeptidase (penicillin-binding protein 5/6)
MVDMRKNSRSLHHLIRLGILIAAMLLILAAIFALTEPLLAPGYDHSNNETPNNSESSAGNSFIEDKPSGDINPDFGKGVQADSFLVYEESSGSVIAARHPNTPVAIASLTKLMTTYVVQKYGSLEDTWAIGVSSTNDIRPVLGLLPGDRVNVGDLVKAMLVGSANDAATALGVYASSNAKQPMIDLMNNEANGLGMASTHYENPIGFDSEQNYSTASDLKLLIDKVHPLPIFSEIDRLQSYSFVSLNGNSYSVKATNTLIPKDKEIHAIKTGFTDEARGALVTSIHHGASRYVIIVLSSPDREGDTLLLKEHLIEELK